MQLEDWLDDLCVRFILNLPAEEVQSVERVCFQVEEAQWFYEDFIRPLDPSLPSLPLKSFSLRIFQHCPTFSTWTPQQYIDAFAEFMAYKSRVPVRGAIMLDESMDEVVLVKGWKKGANWSFPRGKINQGESDLNCAVREVYEETGFDIAAAGLVKDESEMKSIEITMREQHMKLFVFRGVPKDTHFAPMTRKEISKIEWYKLNELPTLKKHRHQDSNGNETNNMSANKFYMVAPFLTPLKKWINQQKKKDVRYTSNLSVPPVYAEEILTEEEQDVFPDPPITQPSDLPEVTISYPRSTVDDATTRVREHVPVEHQVQPLQPVKVLPQQINVEKSNALLALLRGGPAAELRTGPTTPLEQSTFPQNAPQSPHHSHVRQVPVVQQPPLPASDLPPRTVSSPFAVQQPPHHVRQTHDAYRPGLQTGYPVQIQHQTGQLHAPHAPYHRTGDPQFTRSDGIYGEQQAYSVPPASALPVLTTHTKSLLDVLKGEAPVTQPPLNPQPQVGAQSQMLLNMLRHGSPLPSKPSISPDEHKRQLFSAALMGSGKHQQAPVPSSQPAQDLRQPSVEMPADAPAIPVLSPSSVHNETNEAPQSRGQYTSTTRQPASSGQNSLLDLFRPSLSQAPRRDAGLTTERKATAAFELDANSLEQLSERQASRNMPVAHSRNHERRPRDPPLQEGNTSATVSGPLNQPHFDGVVSNQRRAVKTTKRSPLAAHRTLFDPNAPTPIKILSRPHSATKLPSPAPSPRVTPQRSPKPSKTIAVAKSTTRSADAPKPFQPQILKRPQTAESQEQQITSQLLPEAKAEVIHNDQASAKTFPTGQMLPPMLRTNAEILQRNAVQAHSSAASRQSSNAVPRSLPQPERHREALLSLFGTDSQSPWATKPLSPANVVSPLTAGQMFSPTASTSAFTVEPISTRSRVGSMASTSGMTSTGAFPAITSLKRQATTDDNRAFLREYLGKMASQET